MRWFFVILAKLFISRLPVTYRFWSKVGIFKHGHMDSFEYSLKIFKLHVARAYPKGLPAGCNLLELGPGDSIASAVIGSSYGADSIYLVDVGSYARKDISFYISLAEYLKSKGLKAPDLSIITSFEEILKVCNAKYMTEGVISLKKIESNTIDLIWSHSVLEHIRKNEFNNTICEIKRLLKHGGLSSHNIDFQDHLNRSLNNLRFPERVWESDFFSNSGFYTNRIPALVMHDIFKTVGFTVLREEFGRWPVLPISRKYIHSDFKCYSDRELSVRTSHVLLVNYIHEL